MENKTGISDPEDRRNRLVRLTATGKARLKQSDALWEVAQRSFEKGFGGAKSKALREVMELLISDRFTETFEAALTSAHT